VTDLGMHDLTTMFFALAVLLGAAKLAGELMQTLGQPSILGEISAGILLGPTVLGRFQPQWFGALFPSTGPVPTMIATVTTLGVVFFLLAAGLETKLRSLFRQGKRALLVSSFGLVFPFSIGFVVAGIFPHFLGAEAGANRLIFALFVGTALSISALPVIAKILMDFDLLQTELGAVVISSAMFDDLVGWILFGVVLGMIGTGHGAVLRTVILVVLFVVLTLTLGRWLIAKIVPFIQANTSGRGAVLSLVFTLTLAAAGFAEYAGIHAIFGAFIGAVAIGDSLDDAMAKDIRQIVTNVFAPFFFASIGLRVDFVANSDLRTILGLIAIACLGKILGASWGARLGGMDALSAWAVGFAMNARGAMEIVLSTLALRAGLIGNRMFVALVVMALFTSLISAPVIQELTKRRTSTHTPQRGSVHDCERMSG
jgi:Kef-type K+ transport system membrane component KefB